jgi:signal transduction histidine kinase
MGLALYAGSARGVIMVDMGPGTSRLPLLLLPASLAWASFATLQHVRLDQPPLFVWANFAAGVMLVAAGLTVWWVSPINRTWWLLVATGFTWFAGSWQHSGDGIVALASFALADVYLVFLAQAIVGFPTGRLAGAWDRAAVGSVAASLTFRALAVVLLNVPPDPAGYGTRNRFLPISTPTYWHWSQTAYGVGMTVANALVLLAVMRRWRALSRPGRRMLTPALLSAVALTVAEAVQYLAGWNVAVAGTDIPVFYVTFLAVCVVAVSMVVGLVRLRGTRSSVIDLVGALGDGAPPAELESALRRALEDPSLVLLPWSVEAGGYVDRSGRPTVLPSSDAHRSVTLIGRQDAPVAALVHDAALHEDAGMIKAVLATVRLTVDNDRMQSEIRSHLLGVEQSRARILAAGDAERRRIERDLHDGAQQRLVALGLALRLAQNEADGEHRELLSQAADELAAAIRDLRELAHGIHPSVLTESGLLAALESLVDRTAVPTDLQVQIRHEPDPSVGATAYFTVAEAITNAMKHGHATKAKVCLEQTGGVLHLRVSDDGVGGLDPRRGTGWRGIIDRVEAVGGTIRWDSAPGQGTQIEAELPCASS